MPGYFIPIFISVLITSLLISAKLYSKSNISSTFGSPASDLLSSLLNSGSSSSSSDIDLSPVTADDVSSYPLLHVGVIPCFFITGNQYTAHQAAIRKQKVDCLCAYATTPLRTEGSRFSLRLPCSNHHADFHSKYASTRRISS